MPEISRAQWRSDALSIPEKLSQISRSGPDGGLRESIFLLWKSLAAAPSDIKHLYSQVREAQISSMAAAFDMGRPDYGLAFTGNEADIEIVGRLGGGLRALEQEFSELDLGSRPVDPNDWRIEHAGESAFLVPMGRLAWRQPKDPQQDTRPFDQRGLVRLRVIPTIVDGARVRLVRPDHLGMREMPRFGAVLFPEVEFTCTETETTFVVEKVQISGAPVIIGNACKAAHSSDCLTAVFPELTIDPQSRELIRNLLIGKPWHTESKVPIAPAFVVAGSWHEPSGAGFANVATVFDGHGEELLRHRKRFAYKDPAGRYEAIQAGDEFAILVLDGALFAFGICLDFCNRCYDTVYGRLDVDFVVVPSCGDENTMKSHIRTANDLHDSRKTRSFVVQQAYPPVPPDVGYVLNPDGNPAGWTVAGLLKAVPWSVFPDASQPLTSP
jgi:predicted amidohydrolase